MDMAMLCYIKRAQCQQQQVQLHFLLTLSDSERILLRGCIVCLLGKPAKRDAK